MLIKTDECGVKLRYTNEYVESPTHGANVYRSPDGRAIQRPSLLRWGATRLQADDNCVRFRYTYSNVWGGCRMKRLCRRFPWMRRLQWKLTVAKH